MNAPVRRLVIAAGVLLLAASGYAYLRFQDHGDDGFIMQRLDRGPVVSTVTASGTVNPVTSVQVGTYVSGPIKAIYADFNSRVSKDQIVAKIDPAPFQVKVQSATAAVANARAKVLKDEADLALKKLTYERNQKLFDRTLVSQNDLDTAKSGYDQAVAQLALDVAGVQQAQADLDAAKIQLAYTDITSPVDGVVVSRNVDVGQTVAASFQTPTLFLIAQDLTKMQVDTNVSESDIGTVAAGQAVTFRVDAFPDRDFHGKVVQVRNAPINVQNVVTYDVVVAVDNPKLELRPGMTATITIVTAAADDVLRIPMRALRFRPERAAGAGPGASRSPTPGRTRAADGGDHHERGRSLAVFVADAERWAQASEGANRGPKRELRGARLGRSPRKRPGRRRLQAGRGRRESQRAAASLVHGRRGRSRPPVPLIDVQSALIQVENLWKIYELGDVSVTALADVTLEIDRGEFTAIMGASGSGKSTFMNLIGCLDRPTRGRYRLDGVDVSTLSSDERAEIRNRKLGFVFQSFNLHLSHQRPGERRAAAVLRRPAADGAA